MQFSPDHHDAHDHQFAQLLNSALKDYGSKQAAFSQRLAQFRQWHIDECQCTLTLSAEHGASQCFALTPIASYLPQQQDWAWVWANDAWSALARERSLQIQQLLTPTGYQIFSTAHFKASLQDMDELCALALQAIDGQAIFKTKSSEPWCLYVVQK